MVAIKLPIEQELLIPVTGVNLVAFLTIPEKAQGLVLFVHGSGSSRHSIRNESMAKQIEEAGMATLLFDLLTEEEDKWDAINHELRFNIPLLSERLIEVTEWLSTYKETQGLAIGYFGASTGASAALVAASLMNKRVKAIVSRGGRPDLAGSRLGRVEAATLLIVGGADYGVIELNEKALQNLHCQKKLEIVANATHLFEEAGALKEVGDLASKWFYQHFIAD